MSALPRHVPSSTELRDVRWLRSSHSTGMNNCVETARPAAAAGLLAVRDSKNTGRPALLLLPRRPGPASSTALRSTGPRSRVGRTGDVGRSRRLTVASSPIIRTAPLDLPIREIRAGGQPSREMPSGTDGGRKQPTARPAARQSAAQRTRRSGDGARTDTTAASGPRRGQPARSAVRAAAPPPRGPAPARSGSRRSSRRLARAAPAAAGARPVSKMNVRAVLTRWSITRAGPSTAPPWLPSDLDRVTVATTSVRAREPGRVQGAAAAVAQDAQTVRVVDDQRRAVRPGRRRRARPAGRRRRPPRRPSRRRRAARRPSGARRAPCARRPGRRAGRRRSRRGRAGSRR